MAEGGLAGTAARSVAWVSVMKWGSQLLSLVVFAVLGRLIDPQSFGLVALAAVFTTILTLFVDSGFSQVLVQRAEVGRVQVSTAFWTSLGIALVLYGLLAAAAHPLSLLYHQPSLDDVLYVLGLQLPITALSSTPAALLERDFRFRDLTMRHLSGMVAAAVAGVAAALAGWGVWALVVQSVGYALVSCVVLWVRSDWRPSFTYSTAVLKDMWRFGVSILGIEAVNLTNNQADRLVIGSLLGPTALGYYYIGSRVVTLVSDSLTVIIAEVTFTTFSRLQKEPERMLRAFKKATFASATIALPAFGALMVLAPVIIPLLFGSQWTHSVLIMQLLAPMYALNSIIYFDKSALLSRGFGRDTFLLALGNMLLGVALVFLAAPWGIVGIAISRSVRQFGFWPVRLSVLRRRLDLDVGSYLAQFTKPFVATLASTAVMVPLVMLPFPDGARLVVAGLAGVAVYVAAMLLVARSEVMPYVTTVAGELRRKKQPETTGSPR